MPALPHSSPEEPFVRFQRTGESDALAEVFDQTAAELLRVAGHLLNDLHVAEDLVQATFLVAIERKHDYQPGKGSVLSWLTGILINRIRVHRRLSRRGAGRTAADLSNLNLDRIALPAGRGSVSLAESEREGGGGDGIEV